MARQFHRPARLDPEAAEQIEGSTDTAVASELAHRAAQALIGGFPGTETEDDPITRSGIVAAVATNGIDDIAELWADSPATTLPGTLWRLFLVREWIRRDPELVARRYATLIDLTEADDTTNARFESALGAARDVLANGDATQEQVNDALKALTDARAGLAEKPVKPAVDKAALQKAVDDAAELAEDDYTADSWKPFASALNAAGEVLADEEATQEQVNDALKALTDARAGLAEKPVKPAVDKSALQKAVDDLKGLKADDYTAETWAPFETALETAQGVLTDEEATQDQVNDALKALTDAHGALKVKEVTPEPEPKPDPKPEPTPNPGGNTGNAGNKGDKPAAATKPSASSKKDGKDLPTTGDASIVATVLAGGSGAAALAAARVIDRKRRR